jgi:two-component system response regulator AtoC
MWWGDVPRTSCIPHGTKIDTDEGRGIPRIMSQNYSVRVLVVDDEPLIRWSIAETLKEHGHTVLEAENGAAALRELQRSSPPVDVVLLDYRLPDVQNLALLAQIRQIAPLTPVILMTAFGSPEVIEGARHLGACDVMHKPFDMSELEAVVARATQALRARARNRSSGQVQSMNTL